MIVDRLIKRKVYALRNGEHTEVEVDFFFGVILIKLIKKEMNMELEDFVAVMSKIENNLADGIETVVKFMFLAHKGWMILKDKEPEITENDLWFSATAMGIQNFFTLFSDGMNEFMQSVSGNPKMPNQQTSE